MREKHMETSAGMLRGEQDLLKKDQSQSNVALGNVNQGVSGAVQSQAAFQIHQQQPRVSAVCWERYLPRRSLNVLLVESDDSTCHLVSALLRNCGYEVTAATDGLQAWNILVDLTTHIDLVLTEVDMPCLSGTSLLCKIMNHKTCRNIPVIMMSSHDPMVLVLKCLSKGAVDFLVKPVRKNELKNLWQHVWRKYHSANDSDSASESGIHMQKPGKVKNAEKSVNNTQRNNGNANVCIDLNGRDESDSGSRTQSSWIKREVEVDNPFPVSPQDEYVDLADSTCAQVVFPRGEAIVDDPVATTAEYLEDNRGLKGVSIFEATKHERQSAKSSCKQTCTKQDKTSALEPNKDNQQTKMEFMELLTEVPVGELKEQTADLIGLIADGIVQNEPKASERQNKSVMELNDLSSFGLNLKRPREAGDGGGSSHADRNVLRRSEISSSSRYNGISTLNHVSTGRVGSTRVNNTSRTMRTESTNNFPYNSSGTPDKKWNDNCNKNGMGSITVDVLTTLPGSNVKSISTSKIQHVSSPSQPMQNNDTCPSQQMLPQKTVEARGEKQQVQVQHHHHHHHYYHHHMHETQEEQSVPYDEDMQVKNMTTASMQCGSSNVFSTVVEGSDKKYSSNESGSGSKHGSNLPNGSNADVNVGETDLKSENLVPGKTGDCYESQSENRRGVDTIPTEASFNKFTHKRKEKCFKNKVELKPRRS